jgi:hypothetical protein
MNVNFDLAKTFKRDAANRIKGIARAGRLLAKEETIDEAGKNPYGPGYKLVDKDGNELKVGHKFMHTSHHEGSKPEHHEITGWQSGEQRGNSSSSGRVAVKVGKGKKAYDTEYFPHVFDMKVVKDVKEEVVNEVSKSRLASVATQRFAQAQDALKAKDFGGYVKGMKKSQAAADATVPKSGWSPEDDKKNEEVVPVVSAQEKYRQIKEAKMAKAVKSTTTHHNFYIAHEDTDEAAGVLAKHKIPHSVADHSGAPVDHSAISVRHKHYDAAKEAFKKNGIDFGGR